MAWEIQTDTRCNRCSAACDTSGQVYPHERHRMHRCMSIDEYRVRACSYARVCMRVYPCVRTACYARRREPICLIHSPVPRVMDVTQSHVTDEPTWMREREGRIGEAGGVSKFPESQTRLWWTLSIVSINRLPSPGGGMMGQKLPRPPLLRDHRHKSSSSPAILLFRPPPLTIFFWNLFFFFFVSFLIVVVYSFLFFPLFF